MFVRCIELLNLFAPLHLLCSCFQVWCWCCSVGLLLNNSDWWCIVFISCCLPTDVSVSSVGQVCAEPVCWPCAKRPAYQLSAPDCHHSVYSHRSRFPRFYHVLSVSSTGQQVLSDFYFPLGKWDFGMEERSGMKLFVNFRTSLIRIVAVWDWNDPATILTSLHTVRSQAAAIPN